MTERTADPTRLTTTEFREASNGDWRVLDDTACAWFDAPSLTAGADLVLRIAELAEGDAIPDVDLRADGIRVRLGRPGDAGPTAADLHRARAISAAAEGLGLTADPAVLQIIGLEFETADRSSLMDFWRTTLSYEPVDADQLRDPFRRDPIVRYQQRDHVPPLRSRIHLDVVRPPEAVDAIRASLGQEPYGVYELTLADVEGNEIDVVPGDPLGEGPETDDWNVVFAAMASYPTTSPVQAARFATVVAELADQVGVPLMIDLRPDGVTVDSGKDQWEDEVQPAGARFAGLASRIQSAAHDLGLVADPNRARFVQFGIDALDVPAARDFWTTLLGYRHDQREGVTDIYDPRRLNPEIFFQDLDPSDEARRRQRDRIHVVLWVPDDLGPARIDTARAVGGQVVADDKSGQCTLSDPEGNELVLRWA